MEAVQGNNGSGAVVQTPFGAARRCQARSKRSGRQCARPARRGFRVCSTHGAGTRRRELAGVRKNPKLAPIKTGARARPDTIAIWKALDVQLAERIVTHEADRSQLRDLDRVLVRLAALGDVLAGPGAFDGEEGAIRLLGVLRVHAEVIERSHRVALRMKEAAGIITQPDVERFLTAVLRLLEREIGSGDRLHAAVRELRSLAPQSGGATKREVTELCPIANGRDADQARRPAAAAGERTTSTPSDLTCSVCLGFDAGAGWCRVRQFYVPATFPACEHLLPEGPPSHALDASANGGQIE